MSFEIIATAGFRRSLKMLAKRHSSIKEDFIEFSRSIQENPFQGNELSPGIRKIRMSIRSKGRGKSGGARVITYTIVAADNSGKVYLIDIYDKADFTTVDTSVIHKMVKELCLE